MDILTKFVMWSPWHWVFIFSPFIIMFLLWISLRKTSYKTRYIVGAIIGVLSLAVIITRNIYILIDMDYKLDPELIPLQISQVGNIVVFVALVFRSKIAASMAWTLNIACAYLSLPFADSLASYPTIWDVTAQCYIWGHLLIVVGGMYAIFMKIVRINFKSYLSGVGVIFMIMIPALIMNCWFNDLHAGEYSKVNYFYLYDSDGIPAEFIYGIFPRAKYGWFTIDWVYTCTLIAVFIPVTYLFYLSQKLIYLKDKSYDTDNVILALIKRNKDKPIIEDNIKVEIPFAVSNKEEEKPSVEEEDYFKDLKRTKLHYKKREE